MLSTLAKLSGRLCQASSQIYRRLAQAFYQILGQVEHFKANTPKVSFEVHLAYDCSCVLTVEEPLSVATMSPSSMKRRRRWGHRRYSATELLGTEEGHRLS
jgi:hypothetical protein